MRGVRNLLQHCGILAGVPQPAPTRWLDMPSTDCFAFAEQEGLIEPVKDLGETVQRGTVLARIHPISRTGQAPAEYCAAIDGIVAGRHFPGLVKSGDCIAVIGTLAAPPRAAARHAG
jgi:N-alpha-acetyl-L-2,4-diaminobutyrate deacetylase